MFLARIVGVFKVQFVQQQVKNIFTAHNQNYQRYKEDPALHFELTIDMAGA